MKARKNNRKKIIILYCLAYAILALVCVILLKAKFDNSYIATIGLLGGILFLIYICAHYNIVRRFLNFGLIFTIMLFLFCFGQFFLYGLGIKYDYFFLNSYYCQLFKYNYFYVLYGEVISILSIGLFQLAMLITAKYKDKNVINTQEGMNNALKTVSLILFAITFPIMAIYKLYLMFYSFSSGYAAVGMLTQPFFVKFLGTFLIPASIALLVCSMHQKRNFKLLSLVLLVYACVGLIIGGRTEPLIILTSIALLSTYNRKLKLKKLILLLIILYCVATLMVSIAEVRISDTRHISNLFGIFFNNFITFRTIVQLIGEMGFSGSSMIWTVYLVKSGQQNLYFGATYMGAIANILPSSLDVFGVLRGLDKFCHLEGWLTDALGFDFGVGFNLIAEAYLNFGFGAIFTMFFYGLVLNKIFNLSIKKGEWNLYKSLVMFAVLLTLPRRASLYFADQWTLCVIIIWLLCQIVLVCKRSPQRGMVNEKVTN